MTLERKLSREQIAERAAQELPDGAYVNLGWGIPNLIAAYVPESAGVIFHSENGILGMGPRAHAGEEDYDLVDAMKAPVTILPGGAYFSQVDAHMMTRGGHLDVAVLGGLQVSERGDLANWKVPGAKFSGGIGGAMDIAVGSRRLIVTMEHVTKNGEPKIVKLCTYPLTALQCVTTIVTDLAVIDVTPNGLQLREVAPGVSVEEVQKATEPKLSVASRVPEMRLRAK
jgi:3-oxoacid CoA-transferase subunit B